MTNLVHEPSEPPNEPPAPTSSRVWVVDDSPTEAERVIHGLSARFDVATFGDASEVLERIAMDGPPDAIVLDWMLPNVSGIEVCRFLRASPVLREIPVLMLTVRAAQDDLVEALEAGADDFVAKPFQPRELQARVAALLRRRGALRDAANARAALAALLQCLPEPALALDDAGGVVLCNAEAQTLLGAGMSVLGRSLADVLPGVPAALPRPVGAPAVIALPDVEVRGRTYAPTLRALPAESPARAALVLRDVTAYRRVERALRQSEASLRALLDVGMYGVAFWNANGAITEANDAFLAMVGHTRDEMLAGAVKWTALTPPEYAALDARALDAVRVAGSWPPYEKELVRRDGARVPVLVGGAGLDGMSNRGVMIVLDLSGAQHAHERAARAEAALGRAQDEASARDDFVAALSHELRTPLNAIMGWTRILRQGVLSEAARARALESVERNAQAQVRLIEDLLDVSRIANGKLELRFEDLDVRELLERTVDAIRPAADAHALALELDAGDAPVRIRGDAARLHQVLLNLLANAVKFTPERGRVQVRLRAREAFVEIEVSDTGCGIDLALLPHVFERFQQGALPRATAGQDGLGLGLAIADNLVRLHGGAIDALSDGPGTGATFTVRLPR